jgi:hypothetical protein
VAREGEHRPGDRLVFCEIDSLVPERPEFESLRATSFNPARTGFRIKTVTLRGQVSRGICFPHSILPPGAPTGAVPGQSSERRFAGSAALAPGLASVPACAVLVAWAAGLRAPLARDASLAFGFAMFSVIIRPLSLEPTAIRNLRITHQAGSP